MLIMTYAFGIIFATEYILMLTNLTSLNSPMPFPANMEPYPVKEDAHEFIIPWFTKVDFLRENLIWTSFFGIDIEHANINDIWFDFCNLVLLTIYFFSYGNPINAKNIKVSFSQTRGLEDDLDRYARLILRKKTLEKRGKMIVIEEAQNDEEDYNDGASDSQESYLGSTYYLEEMKRSLFIYNFTRKGKFVTFIGAQVITIVMTLVLAILCRSIMSIGYLIACVPLILNITDFFRLE